MELKEAIEWLKEYAEWVNKLNTQYPDTMGVAIDTVLKELDRLQKESISKNKILDKMVEVKLEVFLTIQKITIVLILPIQMNMHI